MTSKRLLRTLLAILATAVFILPGLASGKGGGNGTPTPPPTNPPCDADGHNGSPPPYGGPNKNTGKCKNDHGRGGTTSGSTTGTGGSTTSTATGASTGSTGTSTGSSGSSTSGSTGTSTGSSGSTGTTGTSGTATGSTGSTGSTTATGSTGSTGSTGTSTRGDDVCETDGVLGTKGLGLNAPDDRTIGQILWDELGLVVQDPQIPGAGPISQPLYDGLIQIPLGGLETPVAAEAACLLNNLSL